MVLAIILLIITLAILAYGFISDNKHKTYYIDNYKINICRGNFIYDVEAQVYKKHHLFASYHFNYNYEDFATPAEMAKNAVIRAARLESEQRADTLKEKEFWGN